MEKIIIEELVASEYQDNYGYEDIANSIVNRLEKEYVSKESLLSFLFSRQKEIKEQKGKINTSTMKGSQDIHRLRGIEKELKLIIEFIENGTL